MANYNHKITIKDLLKSGEKIKEENKVEAAERIGEAAIDLMREDMQRYRSSVTGTPFKELKNKDYQKLKGTKKSNLYLSGELQEDGLTSKAFKYGAKLSIQGSKNKLKAENHLKLDNDGEVIDRAAESKTGVRQRKFFPVGEEKLRRGILEKLRNEIRDLIDG